MLTGDQRAQFQDLFLLDEVHCVSVNMNKHSIGTMDEDIFIHITTRDKDMMASIVNEIIPIEKDGVIGNGFKTPAGDTVYIIPAEEVVANETLSAR